MKIALCILTLVLAGIASAGYYEAGLTSGLTAQGGGVTPGNGSITAGAGGGSNSTVSVSGTITTTFTWKRVMVGGSPDLSDNPPETAIVVEDCSVSANAQSYNGGGSASVSNGLGSPVESSSVPMANGFGRISTSRSEGSRAKIVAGGETVTVTGCTVSATASVGAGPCSAGATYGATVSPVIMSVSGTVKDGAALYGEIGRKTSGVLINPKPGISFSSYQWSVTGDKFKTYTHNWTTPNSAGFATPMVAGDFAQPSPTWFWKKKGGKQVSVQCAVAYFGVSIGSVNVTKAVDVEGPDYRWTRVLASELTEVTGSLLYSGGNAACTDIGGIKVGIRYEFGGFKSKHFPTGFLKCAQLVSAFWNMGRVNWISTEGRYDLDSSYPYQQTILTTKLGSPAEVQDSDTPGYGTAIPGIDTDVVTAFELVLMYQPDDPDEQDVPLHAQYWNWNASSHLSLPPFSPTLGIDAPRSFHPEWTRVLKLKP